MRWWLWPASLIWGAAARVRAQVYRRGLLRAEQLPGTVVSVGNLTAGGTGKTPMVLWLAGQFHDAGKRVGILTRGYRAETAGSGGIPQSDEVAIYRERLRGRAELGVGADRFANGEVLARHGVDCFILDDGFQHMQLARDADIVLLDATDPFGGGHLLPAGMLREPASALARADIAVITRSEHAPGIEAGVRRYTNAPVFYAVTELETILPFSSASAGGSAGFHREASAFAFCGIGNPNAFYEDLRKWGIRVAGSRSFADHHVYSEEEVTALEEKARATGASALICTEKDVFNLRNAGASKLPLYFARTSLKVVNSGKFLEAIQEAIKKRRRPADSQW